MRNSIPNLLLGLILMNSACADDSAADPAPETSTPTDSDGKIPSDPPGEVDPHPAAHREFWTAFTQQDFARAEVVTAGLKQLYEAEPNHPEHTLLLAHAYLWQLAEAERDPNLDPTATTVFAIESERLFSEAMALRPDDPRIFGWLGPLMMGRGEATGDAQAIADGLAMIEQGVQIYPEFAHFVRALVLASAPRESPDFARAIESLWQTFDACGQTAIDRENPDFESFFADIQSGLIDPACGNSDRAAHNIEGYLLFSSDLLTKAGQVHQARQMLEVARQVESYSDWPFRALAEARLGDLQSRAAAFADSDPDNDPAMISDTPYSCTYCHAASSFEAFGPGGWTATPGVFNL